MRVPLQRSTVPALAAALASLVPPAAATPAGGELAQQAYLKASNTDPHDLLGRAVAVSGDTLVVGAPGEDGAATGVNGDETSDAAEEAGAVYVYRRAGAGWVQEAYLKASNTGPGDHFGYAVGVSGDTLVVGAPGEDSAATGVDGDQASDAAELAGAAYVFVRSGTAWTQQAYLKASNTDGGDRFGEAVAVAGDTLVVGAPAEKSGAAGVDGDQSDDSVMNAGAAYVFGRTGSTWAQEAYLKAASPLPFAALGRAVAAEDDAVVVGAPALGGDAPGAAHVFRRGAGVWTSEATLELPLGTNAVFGATVAIAGDTIAVGAPLDGSTGAFEGSAWIFRRTGSAWTQEAAVRSPSPSDGPWQFGRSVALSGERLVVGADRESSAATGIGGNAADTSASKAGAAWVFERSGTSWSAGTYVKASNTGALDQFALALALDGDVLLVGAWSEDGGAVGVNGDQASNGAVDAGAAYALDFGGPGVALCFGDGSGTACPCGNAAPSAGAGCAHSGGVGMTIAGAGSASIAADDLALTVASAPLGNAGLFVAGTVALAPGVALFDGLQCTGGDTRRFAGAFQTSGSVTSSGFVAQEPSGTYFAAGGTYVLQYWTRDVAAGPSPCGTGANLSPAYAIVATP